MSKTTAIPEIRTSIQLYYPLYSSCYVELLADVNVQNVSEIHIITNIDVRLMIREGSFLIFVDDVDQQIVGMNALFGFLVRIVHLPSPM